jgi:hypothetical protein
LVEYSTRADELSILAEFDHMIKAEFENSITNST